MNQFNVQLRQILGIVVKYHFWILCGLVVLLGVGIWLYATSGLARATEERRSQLLQAREQVARIRSVANHPNKKVLEAIQREHRRLIEIVYQAWEELYRDQRERNQWPRELGQEFLDVINSLGPDEEIPVRYREVYQYFIKNHFPEWYEIIDLRLPPKRDAEGKIIRDERGRPLKQDPFERAGTTAVRTYGGSEYAGETYYSEEAGYTGSRTMGRGTVSGEELVGIVEWNMQDLQRIRAQFDWPTTPSSFEVRIAQENLWVYEALLRIIRETNEGATSYYNAPVKRIETIQIGQEAAMGLLAAQSRLFGAGMLAGGTGGLEGSMTGGMATMPGLSPGMPMGGPMMPGPMMPGMGMSPYYESEYGEGGPEGMAAPGMPMMPGAPGGVGATAQSPEELIRQRLTHFRYVDKDGKPLAADAPHPFAEFKMMPVRMLLFMDQRRIPRLLVNCANSSMPVQVRVVSLRPGQGREITRQLGPQTTPGYPGMMGGAMGMTGPYGMMGTYPGGEETYTTGYGYGETGGPASRSAQDTGQIDVPVEVAGIIFIFNPPDRTKVGKIGEAEAPGATGMPTLEQALSSMAAPAPSGVTPGPGPGEVGATEPPSASQPAGAAPPQATPGPGIPPGPAQGVAPPEGAAAQPPPPQPASPPAPPQAGAPEVQVPPAPQPVAPGSEVPAGAAAGPPG